MMRKTLTVLGLIGIGVLCGTLMSKRAETIVKPDQPQSVAEVTSQESQPPVAVVADETAKLQVHVAKLSFAVGRNQ